MDNLFEHYTEEEIWQMYRKSKDISIRNAIVTQYAPLVKYVAGKVAMNLPASIDFDDLCGYGVFGLFDAIEKFEPDKNVQFKTYAVLRIRGSIFDERRAIDWVPRSVRQKAKEIEAATARAESKLGRPPKESELAQEMGMSQQDFSKTMMKVSGTSILSLNDLWFAGDENDKASIVDTIEAPSSLNPDNIIEKDEIKRVIVEAINELPENVKKVLILYYYEDLTLKEISKILEVTESRVSQLHGKAIDLLKVKLTSIKKGIM